MRLSRWYEIPTVHVRLVVGGKASSKVEEMSLSVDICKLHHAQWSYAGDVVKTIGKDCEG